MSHQLVKKSSTGGYENVMPKSWIEAIKDKNTGQTLVEILQGFNMYFLSYTGNTAVTRCLVPTSLRKKGLWITYVKYDGNVYTEWYAANEIDDKSWGDNSNWRVGSNTLVGDITISANGNWVINGTETEFKAVGEKGNTPLLRVSNNKLLVSYNLGVDYIDVTDNAVYTKFRVSGNKLQSSTDLGNTWTDVSDYIASQFRWLADSLANNIGRILISRDEGGTWTNLSNDFTNNLHISRYIGANEALPTSGIAEGTIYAKGPTYAVEDTSNSNPIYRLWVYAWKGNTLAWQDNGEFTSIAAGITQETGSNENVVMSQKATSKAIYEILYDVSAHNDGAVFESLQALLSSSNLSTLIPTSVRHGGMTIRFIQSSVSNSDNKYVQYRLMSDTFNTDVINWQGEEQRLKFYPRLVQSNLVSSILSDADNALPNTIYQFASSNKPLNLPSDITLGDSEMLLTTDVLWTQKNTRWKGQYIFDKHFTLLYYRQFINDGWGSWVKFEKREISYYKDLVVGTNYQLIIPDANNAGDFVAYIIEMSQKPNNFPSDYVYSQLGGQPVVLSTIPYVFNGSVRKMQTIYSIATGECFYFRLFNSTWGDWTKLSHNDNGIAVYPTLLLTNNVSTILPDANDALDNTIYKFASRNFPSHFPSWFASSIAYTQAPNISLITITIGTLKDQMIIDNESRETLWSRLYNNGTWGDWESIHHTITVAKAITPSNWRFQSLYEALKFAINNDNTEIEVFDGVYDLITEMGADITGTNYGILLGHNMKLRFHAKAFVTCHYTGDDEDIMSVFSPFICGNGDYEIDGMNLSASKVRYCIHDDMGQETNQYKHIYKNCKFYLDNSASPWVGKQCIGGGLGKNGIIEIINCIFESVGASATGEDSTPPELSYHNSSVADAQSKITVTGCYFVNSGCWFGYYGASTQLTDVVVNNCSMKWAPKLIQESGSYSNINYKLMQWNNEVRS